jgi:hypothetical protein
METLWEPILLFLNFISELHRLFEILKIKYNNENKNSNDTNTSTRTLVKDSGNDKLLTTGTAATNSGVKKRTTTVAPTAGQDTLIVFMQELNTALRIEKQSLDGFEKALPIEQAFE